jgi:hypothetical protein
MYKFSRPDSTHVISTYVNVNVINGDNDGLQRGSRASGISALIGLIRTEEVANAKAGVPHAIPHVLCVGIPNEMLKAVPTSADGEISSSGRAVWPARLRDNDATTAYSGTMPMGTMLGIPSTVDIDALTLSPEGHALAEAFQDYGGYVLLRAGTVALFVEGDDVDTAATARMRSDYQTKIYPLLRVITNNTSTNVGGGGNRRRPDALPFAP